MLEKAYKNSLCVLGAYKDDKLVGIIRAVGDGVTIVFIQDIVILPVTHRNKITLKNRNTLTLKVA